jgi:structural maintenance of chromosome 2
LIPLNQIAKQSLSATVVERAKELVGENNVNLALDLVGCDDEVESAIRFVFGQTLICKDAAAAKRVTFDRSINARSVTLDGDS